VTSNAPDLHNAVSKAIDAARQLGSMARAARRRVVEQEVELEDVRQDLGRARARLEEVEPVLRRIADENVEAVVDPGDVLFEVRELLGLDGRTGAREVGDRG
jgi:small ligand-binding sensory domain FIST